MENLKVDTLEIKVGKEEDGHIITWLGKSELRNPSEVLNPYLTDLLDTINATKLVVDFKRLEFMNSSTFPALLSFMKNCDKRSIPTVFHYDNTLEWQVASFKPLVTISKTLKNVKIEGN
jgi:hypothetical protein